MKSFLYAATVAILLAACTRTDVSPLIDESDQNWIRLSVPDEGEALSVAGSIDDILYVSTMFKIYRTVDKGRSWELILRKTVGPNSVLLAKDTLFLLTNRGGTPATKLASHPTEYSLNGGKTWQPYRNPSAGQPNLVLNHALTSTAVEYRIKENTTPINSMSAYVNPSTILKRTSGTTTELVFPFNHVINALYLDSANRLYVAVSGEHIVETNRIYCCDRNKPSYVYVSKRSQP